MPATLRPLNQSVKALSTLTLLVTCFAQTKHAPRQSVSPPQVKETVEAVVGYWVGYMTATVPGSKSEQFPWEMDCRPVALRSGAACSMKGTASIGPLEEACLVAYDPEGAAVHFMCVTSMREVHDHKGQWTSDQKIQFEPYRTSMSAKPVTEDVTFDFPNPKSLKSRSVVTMEDGSSMAFEFSGTRK